VHVDRCSRRASRTTKVITKVICPMILSKVGKYMSAE
jgi:hypothetical protein